MPPASVDLVLDELRIIGLGVIDDAVVELGPGLTVLTGETGAGKTMVVQGLHLLFGGRADVALVRPGSRRAVVEGRLVVDPEGAAARRAVEAGAELDDDTLLVARTVAAEGRSRAHVGGRGVPVAVLAELAEELVTVHGQSDQQRLLRPGMQRAALDRYAGPAVLEPLGRYRAGYERWRAVEAELAERSTRARDRAQEADLLRLGLASVREAAPQPGEDAALSAEVERLSHADALRAAAERAHEALLGDPGRDDAEGSGVDATGLVGRARQAISGACAHDPALGVLADRLAEVSYLLADVAADLASYAADLDTDPVRLAAAQERQAVLAALTRRYAPDLEGVLAWAATAQTRLAELDGDGERVDELVAERAALLAELGRLAGVVSQARVRAAERFGRAVSAELAELAMPAASVLAACSSRPAPGGSPGIVLDGRRLVFGPDGVDEVELLLVPHPGASPRPVQRGASGGELSRVMLAVEVVFAGADPVPTMVYDEVDAGVGGRAAVEMGRRLARLARDHQVVVVTHLPQVAAFADRHLLVVKSDDGSVTRSGVVRLDPARRVRELSRMLAGLEKSELARGHAEELLAAAASAKGGDGS